MKTIRETVDSADATFCFDLYCPSCKGENIMHYITSTHLHMDDEAVCDCGWQGEYGDVLTPEVNHAK